MDNLFVITYKRPAIALEQKLMNLEFVYDCEALPSEELAEITFEKNNNMYEDVEMFQCESYEYLEFVKNTDAYAEFQRTGSHSMKPIEEDVDTTSNTSTLINEDSIDEGGPYTKEEIENELQALTKNFTVAEDTLKAWYKEEHEYAMEILSKYYDEVSESRDGDWYVVSFSSLNDNAENEKGLNEDNLSKVELCEAVIDDLIDLLNKSIEKCNRIEKYFDDLGIHSSDIHPYMTNYLEAFITSDGFSTVTCEEFKNRLEEIKSKVEDN